MQRYDVPIPLLATRWLCWQYPTPFTIIQSFLYDSYHFVWLYLPLHCRLKLSNPDPSCTTLWLAKHLIVKINIFSFPHGTATGEPYNLIDAKLTFTGIWNNVCTMNSPSCMFWWLVWCPYPIHPSPILTVVEVGLSNSTNKLPLDARGWLGSSEWLIHSYYSNSGLGSRPK